MSATQPRRHLAAAAQAGHDEGDDLFSHETIGKLALGIDPDSQPRWG